MLSIVTILQNIQIHILNSYLLQITKSELKKKKLLMEMVTPRLIVPLRISNYDPNPDLSGRLIRSLLEGFQNVRIKYLYMYAIPLW